MRSWQTTARALFDRIESNQSHQWKIFDKNNDGKLSLSEMAQLVPIKENILKATIGDSIVKGSQRKLALQDIDRIFQSYDKVLLSIFFTNLYFYPG